MANFVLILQLLCATINIVSGSTVVNNVYNGITIAISSDLSDDRCDTLINKLQVKFQESSRVLKESVGFRFGKISVIIPKQWDKCGHHHISNINGQLTWDKADIRLGPTHPVFGNQPWTDQFKSCGLPGNYIYLSESFIEEDSFAGNVIVHEWAKYRWGIFEEYGITGDPIYPSHILFGDGKSEPNLCTNRKIQEFDRCEFDESCRYKYDTDHNKHISSSIMAAPEIPSAKSFCIERTHKSNYPNKQNLLCEGKSTWDVIREHSDFSDMRSKNDDEEVLEFKLVRENTGNALVIAMENTDSTSDATNRLTFIKESISQFIKYELIDSYEVGFIEFADISEKIVQLTVLDSIGRDLLMDEVMSVKISKKSNANLLKALEISSEILEDNLGIIMLITSCPNLLDNFQLEQMISAAKGNQVWVILYPFNVCPQSKMLAKLTERTEGQIIYIKDEILPAQHPYVSPTIRMRLSQSYRFLLQSESKYGIQQIRKEKCKGDEVWCKREININDDFNQLHYLYFYYDYKEHVFASSEVAVYGDGSCNLIEMSPLAKGTKIFECNIHKGSSISISVERDRPSDILLFELVGVPSRSESDYNINIWSSNALQNLTYTQSGVPAVHAELTYEERRILNANVTMRIQAENIATNHHSYVNLNDQGVGADITGNDGIYSGYILPTPLDRTILLSIYANDNDKNTMIWPNSFDFRSKEKIVCCGSKLSIGRFDGHKETFAASICNVPASIHISSSYISIAPSQVRDLIATQVGKEIVLTFTSPGQDLDYGIANFYVLSVYEGNLERESYRDRIKTKPKISGSKESINVEVKNCSSIYGFRVSASDDSINMAKESNLAIIQAVCKHRRGGEKISAGKTAGIVIGVLIAILIVVLLFFWLRRRKRQNIIRNEKLIIGQLNGPLLEEGRDVIPADIISLSRPIRSIEDLTATQIEESLFVQMPLTESPTKSKSMNNLEANELVQQSMTKRKQSRDLPAIPSGDMPQKRASTSSSPNIIGIPLLLDEAIEYKKKKMEKDNKRPDIINVHQLQYPYSPSSSSDGTEI